MEDKNTSDKFEIDFVMVRVQLFSRKIKNWPIEGKWNQKKLSSCLNHISYQCSEGGGAERLILHFSLKNTPLCGVWYETVKLTLFKCLDIVLELMISL